METVEQLFQRYEEVARVVGEMLSAARADQWNTLIKLQESYTALVDSLRPVDAGFDLNETQRARKHELIRRILLDDAAIRDLITPRLARLSALLASNRHTKQLQEMYGVKAQNRA
jgi:flagellar protein FliT